MTPASDPHRFEILRQAHQQHTGDSTPLVFQAPGRVNLLGEHTDYSGGFCMPAALSFNTLIAVTPHTGRSLRLHSLNFNESIEIPLHKLEAQLQAQFGDQLPPQLDVHLEAWRSRPGLGHWSAYIAGVAWALAQRGIPIAGASLTLLGNVPPGAGLSSSASVEVATATTLLALAGRSLPKPEVALACQHAENAYVGAPCGIMDQFISAAGVAGNALAIDTRALTAELAPIPAALRLVVCNSMVTHSVAGQEYSQRRAEVEEAAAAIARINPHVTQLRDATLAELEAARPTMSPEAFLRGRHVMTDSQRVLDGVAALRAGDVHAFGRLMNEAHVSFRDDFAASHPDCDLLVTLAQQSPACLGSRLTGGGFGGCTVSLVHASAAEAFARDLQSRYLDATGKPHADVFVCEIADGAGPVE